MTEEYDNFGNYQTPTTVLTTATNSLNSLVPNLVDDSTSASALQSGSMNLQGSLVNGFLQSSNFKAGTVGWQIKANGDVEFNNGIFRGTVSAATIIGGSIYIPNQTTPLFSVDAQGNVIASSLQRRDFHWFTIFESTSNYLKSGSVSENFSSVHLSINNSTTYLKKGIAFGDLYSWTKPMSVSCGVQVNQSTNQYILLVAGDAISDTTEKIGFLISTNTLYGTTADGSNKTLVNLGNFSGVVDYDLKAVYYPGVRADFYVNGNLVNNITTTLPSGNFYAGIMLFAYMYTSQAVTKTLDIFYWDFWQGV